MKFRLLPTVLLAALACAGTARAEPGATLRQTLEKGYVSCGVAEATGFAAHDAQGAWRGFDVDLCRALAAAIFDNPGKTRFMALAPKDRVSALQAGWVDVLASAPPWTQSRDSGQRVLYAAVDFYDGQGFLVRRQRGFTSAQDLSGVSVCVQMGTPHELELAEFFHERKLTYEPRTFQTFEEAAAAYAASQCDALTADASTLYGERATYDAPSEHAVLPDMLSKAPRGPMVRENDDQWLNIVRWTLFAMLDAEELQVSLATADESLKSENPNIRRLLGVDGDLGADLGLARNWAYRIVKNVGNYADIFESNLGQASPLAMERRLNGLWTKGGLMYAPPVR